MSSYLPQLLALDFDGVICDGLIEYFQTTQRTYQQIWNQQQLIETDQFASRFYHLRPVIETGWEMPILLRALVLGFSDPEILENWGQVVKNILETEQLNNKNISQKLDEIRDNWIKFNLENWLSLHRFYPGVIEKIQAILKTDIKLYIITTKEGRFVKQILQQQDINLDENQIIGKENKRPKYETLRQLIEIHHLKSDQVWFIEDRLEALELVQKQADLQGIKLYLAAWGYNTRKTRDSLKNNRKIQLLTLENFSQDFTNW